MTNTEFLEKCQAHGLKLTEKQMEQFRQYKDLLQSWNEKMNLTAITEDGAVWEKHFYDSLLPFFAYHTGTMCDVGTGAGFPGIPCAIAWPHLQVCLVEPLQKRCRFLTEVKEQLQLANVTIYNERAEDFARNHRAAFDIVTSRAVARLSVLLELCAPLVSRAGVIVGLKGPGAEDELKKAVPALKKLHIRLDHTDQAQMEDGSTRMNMYFVLESDVPALYPRPWAQIKKAPLEVD